MEQLAQPKAAYDEFIDYVEAHIPAGQDRETVPVQEAPWDSILFQKLSDMENSDEFYYYATLRAEVAGYITEILEVSVSSRAKDGDLNIGNDGDSVTLDRDSGRAFEEIPRFIAFFDRLLDT